ncbi:MAG: hypothetical protein WCD18_02715 [Thermosynechococcaceae cyanobacterium]
MNGHFFYRIRSPCFYRHVIYSSGAFLFFREDLFSTPCYLSILSPAEGSFLGGAEVVSLGAEVVSLSTQSPWVY